MRSRSFRLIGFGLAALLMALGISGCGVVPARVSYAEVASDGSAPFGYPFRPRRSILVVSYSSADKRFVVEPAPTELDSSGAWVPLYQLSGVDNWRSTTQIKVTYLPETKIVDEMTFTTTDNVAETIAKIGDVLAAAVPVIASAVAGDVAGEKVAFQSTTFDPARAGETWHQDEVNRNYCLRLRNVSVEQGLSLTAYFSSRKGGVSSDFPVASCATGVLEIAQCPLGPVGFVAANPQRLRVNFASSDRVTPIGIPSSGAMKMNAVCGAVVTEADKQDRSDLTNYLTSLIDAVKKIEAAKTK